VKPIEFYNLGVAVAPKVASEAERRSVVGRIYYGLHHEACCRFFRVNSRGSYLGRDRSRHTALVAMYRNSRGNIVALRISNMLDQLRRLRTTADYDLAAMTFNNRPISEADLLATAVKIGELLLRDLEQYSPGEADDGCQCVSP
jgi:hypothetical protein